MGDSQLIQALTEERQAHAETKARLAKDAATWKAQVEWEYKMRLPIEAARSKAQAEVERLRGELAEAKMSACSHSCDLGELKAVKESNVELRKLLDSKGPPWCHWDSILDAHDKGRRDAESALGELRKELDKRTITCNGQLVDGNALLMAVEHGLAYTKMVEARAIQAESALRESDRKLGIQRGKVQRAHAEYHRLTDGKANADAIHGFDEDFEPAELMRRLHALYTQPPSAPGAQP